MKFFFQQRFIKYILIGIFNTAFSYGIYSLFLFVGLRYQFANLLALILGIGVSFLTQGNIVFQNATKKTFLKFVIAWTFVYCFNITIIASLIYLSLSAYLAGAIAIIPGTFVSYFILKYAVFGATDPHHKRTGDQPYEH